MCLTMLSSTTFIGNLLKTDFEMRTTFINKTNKAQFQLVNFFQNYIFVLNKILFDVLGTE